MSQPVTWDGFRAVVFDVDGTLYDGGGLRRRMLLELAVAVARRPTRARELRALQTYRAERERLADEEASGILRLQYERPATRLGMTAIEVRNLVDPWILEKPLPLLERYRIAGARRFFERLRRSGRIVAVWSDYPASAKLEALGLVADYVVCGTDPEIDRLKPSPKGLEALLEKLRLTPTECLLIGDRDDRDGEAARRVGVECLLRSNKPRGAHQFSDFRSLLESFGDPVSRAKAES